MLKAYLCKALERKRKIIELFAKYNYNDQVNEDQIGRECSTNGGEE
jgi:hypothetical protein